MQISESLKWDLPMAARSFELGNGPGNLLE